ncbi:SDR family oxidoreductase [Asticcacaulis sp. 201]|uniref:SDR family oxidoreductase n=1 Tax=Asticcacaulis sp. 201 TaxID=3028787 RepID=UPI0029169E08|nr:SDR family oxidoreductase [Asticcacaulis sp. 201]MDV6331241.1 SDR family oxidoreductase [Asticcacaulis sp. 201]
MSDRVKGLIVGVANEGSLAWGCAEAIHRSGADLFITCQDDQRVAAERLAAQIGASHLMTLDVIDDRQMEAVFDRIQKEWGRLDFLIHSIAFAPEKDLLGNLTDSSMDGFASALDVSCHSFIRLAKRARLLMPNGGAMLTMSYYGAEKVMPHYNLMGLAKAALEASVRYLAWELGTNDIRVNALSPGPVRSRIAPHPQRFDEMMQEDVMRIPLRQAVTLEQIGNVAAFMVSPAASGITGQVIHVDNGYSAVG